MEGAFANQRNIRARSHARWKIDGETAGLERIRPPKASLTPEAVGHMGGKAMSQWQLARLSMQDKLSLREHTNGLTMSRARGRRFRKNAFNL